jgi:hypothetical protein
MDILSPQEIDNLVASSSLVQKYKDAINKESAYEILSAKMNQQAPVTSSSSSGRQTKPEPGMFDQVLKSPLAKSVGNTFMRELLNMLFSLLGLKKEDNFI